MLFAFEMRQILMTNLTGIRLSKLPLPDDRATQRNLPGTADGHFAYRSYSQVSSSPLSESSISIVLQRTSQGFSKHHAVPIRLIPMYMNDFSRNRDVQILELTNFCGR